ncbi:MAG: ABC transporter ATP-binding protein [Lachnospiraceae bacterium]|nr:ABC transporter ATP-binding protein [Lachnospiraceae bacterium]
MEIGKTAIRATHLEKKFRHFSLNIQKLEIPRGFATALIGENGAGKTTLMNILAGIRLDYKGEITFFEKWNDRDREREGCPVRELTGYTGTGGYFLPQWTVQDVGEVSSLLFENFDRGQFDRLCRELNIVERTGMERESKISQLSEGNRTKLLLAGVLARKTELLLMDEPASPLDPLMRERLCGIIQEYLASGNGEKSVFFSTHNVSDMENVTDYAVIMSHGRIVERGFVEDLKSRYVLVKGEKEDAAKAREALYTIQENKYGFEGLCLADQMEKLAGIEVTKEIPSLYQISVAVMRKNA